MAEAELDLLGSSLLGIEAAERKSGKDVALSNGDTRAGDPECKMTPGGGAEACPKVSALSNGETYS